jgi:GAF domain-containing protein
MARQRTTTVAKASRLPDDEARLVMLRRSGVLDLAPDPEFDRWTAALRRSTGAAVGALCFLDASCQLVKSVCTVDGSADQVSELALSTSFEHHVVGLAPQTGSAEHTCVYAEAPITVDGQLFGQIGMADDARRDWAEADLETLADTATAVSTAIALRLAKKDAQRV